MEFVCVCVCVYVCVRKSGEGEKRDGEKQDFLCEKC